MKLYERLCNGFKAPWARTALSNPILRRTLAVLYWSPAGIVFFKDCYAVKAVSGTSMQPVLNPDGGKSTDVVLFDRWSVRMRRTLNRGDIVAVQSPVECKLLVKRIIALEGDTVQTLPPYPDPEIRVPKGNVWIEGDRSFRSQDSNHFGPIPLALVDAKLTHILWPINRWGPLPPHLPVERKGVPRGSDGYHDMAAVEHGQWQKARAQIATGISLE